MSTKLRNIDAIKKMLDGNHKSQTATKVGLQTGIQADTQRREVGEIWKDSQGVEWEQRAGFKIQKGKMDEIRTLINAQKMPSTCPKCSREMKSRADQKIWKLEGHCLECQIEFEHELRIEGKYEAYEKERILKSAESWLAEAEQEAKEIIEAFRNPVTYTNVDGTSETWTGQMTAEEIADKIETQFKEFKEDFLEKLKS
jgi:ribosomal protein L37AE/L43A